MDIYQSHRYRNLDKVVYQDLSYELIVPIEGSCDFNMATIS
jgi:hypothetical protein